MCYRNVFCGTRRRIEWMPTACVGTLGGGGPGWLRMNLKMHLHLNSEFTSNEFRTECARNLDLKSEGYRRGLI